MEVLEIMAQMLQYITFLSLKSIEVSSDIILNYLKKVVGGATTQKYQKQMLKPHSFFARKNQQSAMQTAIKTKQGMNSSCFP